MKQTCMKCAGITTLILLSLKRSDKMHFLFILVNLIFHIFGIYVNGQVVYPSKKCLPGVCTLLCPEPDYGLKLDEYGCWTCRCRLAPCPQLDCRMCKYGYVIDHNGCPTCECKPRLDQCTAVCLRPCKYGNIPDESGCPTCLCRYGPCKKRNCKRKCKEYALDAEGCSTCKCKECLEPKAPGFCLAYLPSYYYDPWAGKCKKFIYGGCFGNRNRFVTKKQCYRRCKKK